MASVSQKMEAEFREMLLNEKLKKKQALEGPCGVRGIFKFLYSLYFVNVYLTSSRGPSLRPRT